MKKNFPDLYYERILWKKNFVNVAGLDEVGRGAFAGPVVAGCVVFSPNILHTLQGFSLQGVNTIIIKDSKMMTKKQRETASEWIIENSLCWGIGESSVSQINKIGIVGATNIAFRKALYSANTKLQNSIDYLLIDAYYIPYTRNYPVDNRDICNNIISFKLCGKSRQAAIAKGDQKSVSIAAASIIAKVYRDKLMKQLGCKKKFIKYGWINNKGYGTKKHRDAILKHGIVSQHRSKFVSNLVTNH